MRTLPRRVTLLKPGILPKNWVSPERIPLARISAQPQLRQSEYMNNVIEQDHQNIKRLAKPMMGFGSFYTARRTLSGIEAMSMICKGQVKGVSQRDSVSQAEFIAELFGITLSTVNEWTFIAFFLIPG
nr:DDE-type integrase/transposase/recombinase [Phormidesmis priestleyi]